MQESLTVKWLLHSGTNNGWGLILISSRGQNSTVLSGKGKSDWRNTNIMTHLDKYVVGKMADETTLSPSQS